MAGMAAAEHMGDDRDVIAGIFVVADQQGLQGGACHEGTHIVGGAALADLGEIQRDLDDLLQELGLVSGEMLRQQGLQALHVEPEIDSGTSRR